MAGDLVHAGESAVEMEEVSLGVTAEDDEDATRPAAGAATKAASGAEAMRNWSFEPVLATMTHRKALRQTRGKYQASRPVFTFACFFFLAGLTVFSVFKVTVEGAGSLVIHLDQANYDTPAEVAFSVSVLVLVLIYILFLVKVIVRFNLILGQYITIIAIVLQLVVIFMTYLAGGQISGTDVFGAYLWIMLGYIVIVFSYKSLKPGLAIRPLFLPKPFDLEVMSSGDGVRATFRYTNFLCCASKPSTISYEGSVDSMGRPHGMGKWTDSAPHGEVLTGEWVEGKPVGPFKSREVKSNSGFTKVRVGFFSCRAEPTEPPQATTTMPKYCETERISVGIMTAECSISGKFFRDFPIMAMEWEEGIVSPLNVQRSDIEEGKQTDRSAVFRKAFRRLVDSVCTNAPSYNFSSQGAFQKTVAVLADPHRGIIIPSYERMPGQPGTASSVTLSISERVADSRDGEDEKLLHGPRYGTNISVEGWVHKTVSAAQTDAVIYIHGYNSSCDNGCKLIGQLWTFGSFPAFVRPYVFSWPTGTIMAFPWGKRSAEADEGVKALRDMIIGIASTGITRFHFMGHSMGIRTFCKALPLIEHMFSSIGNASQPAVGSTEEIAGGLGRVTLPGKLQMSTVTFMNPEFGVRKFAALYLKKLQCMCEVLTVYGDTNDVALKTSYWLNNFDSWICKEEPWGNASSVACGLGKEVDIPLGKDLNAPELQGTVEQGASLDLIDCTHLDVNVQGSRHNGFSLNRSLVEDIYEIIVHREAAQYRVSRLERLKGNVFSFLVAPKYVDGANT